MTASRSNQYQANDVKYRKLRLEVDSAGLRYLCRLDSIYSANTDSIREEVEERERLKQERLELLDRIQTVDKKLQPPADRAGEKKKARL